MQAATARDIPGKRRERAVVGEFTLERLAQALARLGGDRTPSLYGSGLAPERKGSAATLQEYTRRKLLPLPPKYPHMSNLWRYKADPDHPLPPDEVALAHANAVAFRPEPRR